MFPLTQSPEPMKTATRLLALLAVLAPAVLPTTASAQTPLTVREIIRVPEANLTTLQNLGINATQQDVDDNIVFVHDGEPVQFTAVVLTDPYNSGNASWVEATNTPGRVHVFVRDTTANSQGYDGMTIQIVDGSASVLAMQVGSVYDIIGTVDPFGTTVQLSPTVFELVGTYQSLGLPDEIVQPRSVSTNDLNRVVGQDADGNDLYQANWANFNDLNNEYVLFESAVVEASEANDTGRPNYQWRSSGADAVVNSDDISLRYRNDRSGGPGYPNPPYATRPPGDPFVPPATGAVIRIQGFASFPAFDFDNDIEPGGAAFVVAPWEDEDLQSLESPPVFGSIEGPDDVPGNEPVTISAEVIQGSDPIASVVLSYEASTGESGDVTLTDDGSGVYSGDIPALPDGAFVTYFVTATDDMGQTSTSAEQTYRVLYDGINSIEDVQLTASRGPGASPFAGITTDNINLEATVQTGPVEVTEGNATFTLFVIQDGTDPWSGVVVVADENSVTLAPGDEITITSATVEENFGLTRLRDITFEETGTGTPFPYITDVPTGVLAVDPPTAESYEGMMIRFDDVIITEAVANNFGAFAFASDGDPANEVLGEDDATAIPDGFNEDTFEDGDFVEFIQGVWYYSFGSYKVLLTDPSDVGMVTTDAEDGTPSDGFTLVRAYPNPFTTEATIAYEVGEPGPVALRVYDALGREVAVLVDAEVAPGRYAATLSARGLAAGVYVYRLTAAGETRTGRVTLVK